MYYYYYYFYIKIRLLKRNINRNDLVALILNHLFTLIMRSVSIRWNETVFLGLRYTHTNLLLAIHLRLSMRMIKLYEKLSSTCNVPHIQCNSQQTHKSDTTQNLTPYIRNLFKFIKIIIFIIWANRSAANRSSKTLLQKSFYKYKNKT